MKQKRTNTFKMLQEKLLDMVLVADKTRTKETETCLAEQVQETN